MCIRQDSGIIRLVYCIKLDANIQTEHDSWERIVEAFKLIVYSSQNDEDLLFIAPIIAFALITIFKLCSVALASINSFHIRCLMMFDV